MSNRKGFTQVLNIICSSKGISGSELKVYLYIQSLSKPRFPSYKAIHKATGLTRQTISNCLKSLVARSLISVSYGGLNKGSNIYEVIDDSSLWDLTSKQRLLVQKLDQSNKSSNAGLKNMHDQVQNLETNNTSIKENFGNNTDGNVPKFLINDLFKYLSEYKEILETVPMPTQLQWIKKYDDQWLLGALPKKLYWIKRDCVKAKVGSYGPILTKSLDTDWLKYCEKNRIVSESFEELL